MYYIGLISGTSMDAIDAALIAVSGQEIDVVHYLARDLPAALSRELQSMTPELGIRDCARLDHQLGEVFADAANALLQVAAVDRHQVTAIGSHGQTVFHAPEAGVANSVQIADPNVIAARTGITTVADLRRMDMAHGGQGAPLAPVFHQALFAAGDMPLVIVNIGGIANLTLLPGKTNEAATGFDTGPGNTLLDAWYRRHQGGPFDDGGQWAAGGTVDSRLLQRLLADPYFSAPAPKSTGKEYFNLAWLHPCLADSPGTGPADVQCTLLELTARTIADAVSRCARETPRVLVCGGGVHNDTLLSRLAQVLSATEVASTATAGVDPDAVEAAMCAWLAKCRLDNSPVNLPAITGAQQPSILGAIHEPGGR